MSVFPKVNESINKIMRLFLPFVFIISFFFMSMISIPHVGMGGGNQLFLITLYYWSTYRPTLLPLWLVLIMGIIMDALIGSPLGLNALLLGMVRLWTTDQRRFLMAQSFFVNWIIFSLMAILYYLAQWATHSSVSYTHLTLPTILLV